MTDPIPSPRSPQPDPLREAASSAFVAYAAALTAGATGSPEAEALTNRGLSDAMVNLQVALAAPIPSPDTDPGMWRDLLERTARMGSCSQTHHEFLARDARLALSALSSSSESTETLDTAPEPERRCDFDCDACRAEDPDKPRLSHTGGNVCMRCECPICGDTECRNTDEPHCAAPERATLDVERLAEAMHVLRNHLGQEPAEYGDHGPDTNDLSDAEWIAARLTDSREQTAAPVEGMRE